MAIVALSSSLLGSTTTLARSSFALWLITRLWLALGFILVALLFSFLTRVTAISRVGTKLLLVPLKRTCSREQVFETLCGFQCSQFTLPFRQLRLVETPLEEAIEFLQVHLRERFTG